MNVFTKHQVAIAKKTLTLSDAGALVLGGMTKDQARKILKDNGWSDSRISKLEA
jgi:hypothetical protein